MIRNNQNRKGAQGGYVLITSLIFLMAGGGAVVAGLSDGVVREVRSIRNESYSKQGYFASESALEDALYRIRSGMNIDATETVSLGSSQASVTITTGSEQTIVTSQGTSGGTTRSTAATLSGGESVGFNYAIQGGLGGIDIASGINITGSLYTTGTIRSAGNASISGQAVSAEVPVIYLDQDNSTPATPTQFINFGNAASTQDFAQSFTVSSSTSLMSVQLYIRKIGNPSNATVKITANSGSNPNFHNPLASGTLSSSLLTESYQWVEITLTANPILNAGTTYWIVIDANPDVSNYYSVAANNSYSGGQGKIGRGDWGQWGNTSPSGLDMYFKAYIGSNKIGVAGHDTYNRLTVGSAYANQVSFVNASGVIYCQEGGSNNKPCDTSRADPIIERMPVPNDAIEFWKAEAEAGGTLPTQTVGSTGATIGPKKINGNLNVGSGGTLQVSGTLWVTGNVNLDGGAMIRSADSSKSFAIVSDGSISVSGGAKVNGGANSHILFISTSTDDPAIYINGGTNSIAAVAPNGIMRILGGATVKAISAKHVYLSGNSTIIYDPEMSMLNISGGSSSSGPLNIKSWREVE
ncbi:MAG: choice-of-anchor R domain-containing protein [bacterium]|nr:choice-of-anchor R domain-containing protein [bacterium]